MVLRRNKKLNCRKSTGESGGIQASGACGPGLQGGWGPGPQGLGPGPPNLLVGAWRRRGCRLKRLLRWWGPGGKRSRDTPPTPPPPPPHPPAFWGKGERKRVFTLSAFVQHAQGGRIKGYTRSVNYGSYGLFVL